MFYNYHEDYQFDSCISKGICSINPRTSSLREVLVMYLKHLAFYTLQLKHLGVKNEFTEDIILNTLSGLMSNLESGNEQFYQTLINLKSIILETLDTYKKVCAQREIKIREISTELKLNKELDITDLIQQGEREFARKLKLLPEEKRTLYEIMFLVLKSICINLVEIKTFGLDDDKAYSEILYMLNTLNYPEIPQEVLIKKIDNASKTDYRLTKRLYDTRVKEYGEPTDATVSYSTRPNKAILVAGTNIQELKNVLDFTKDKNIDVYTHGEMIASYTYPKFREYNHLRGQFGKGIENCLLDFATFPGSILIAKHSLENIEYLYRGRLFTTDNFVPQGVVKIEHNDYSGLVDSALKSKGFKTGKERESVKIGFSKEEFNEKFDNLINNIKNYNQIIIIGTEIHTVEQREYFDNLIKHLPKNVAIISLSKIYKGENIINISAIPEFYAVYKIFDNIKDVCINSKIKITTFLSKCDKHTISNIITLKQLGMENIYLSKCTPIMLNPTLTNTLKNLFNIKPTTTPSKDIEIE
jgi:hydroxylamine reductase